MSDIRGQLLWFIR